MLAFACIHTHDVNYQKKIQTCVRKIRFYVVFGSKEKKKSHTCQHIHAYIILAYSCTYHVMLAYSCKYHIMLVYSCMHNHLNSQKEIFITYVLIIMHHVHTS